MNRIKNYGKLFAHIKPPDPSEDLFDKIMFRIHREERLVIVKRKIALFSMGLIGSGIGFVPAFNMVWNGFSESGFFKFLSLIGSDTGIVMAYWQSFAMFLLESLPVVGLIALLAAALVFLESLKLLVKNLNIVYSNKQLIKA